LAFTHLPDNGDENPARDAERAHKTPCLLGGNRRVACQACEVSSPLTSPASGRGGA
jgi:hypothetical protein